MKGEKNLVSKLMEAVKKDDADEVENLALAGADINSKDQFGNSVLMEAIRLERYKAALALIKCDADVNSQNNLGYTALIKVVQNGKVDLFNSLIAVGVNVRLKTKDGHTALSYNRTHKSVAEFDNKLCWINDGVNQIKINATYNLDKIKSVIKKVSKNPALLPSIAATSVDDDGNNIATFVTLQKDLGLLELLNANNLIHFSSRNQNNETVIDVAKKQYKKSDSLLKKMFNKKEIALLQNICKFLEDSQSKYNDYLYLRQTSRILDGIIFADKTNHIPEITHIVDSYLDEKKTNWYDQEIKKLKPRSVISGSVYQQFQESEENLEI